MKTKLESINLENWPFEKTLGIAYGHGERLQLEIIYSEHNRPPNEVQLRSAWKTRQNRRGVPLLIVVFHGGKANVCGPTGDEPAVYLKCDSGQIDGICEEALEQPSRLEALRSLRDSLSSIEESEKCFKKVIITK